MANRTEIDRLAGGQDDVVSRKQLVQLGAQPGYLASQVRRGAWQAIHPGVAVVHSGPVPWRTRARAALLYCGDGAALSHSSAAYHWEIVRRPSSHVIEVSLPWPRRAAP